MLNIRMKGKRSLLTAVAAFFLIGAMIDLGSTSDSTTLYVDPPSVLGAVGGTITVDIMIEDVSNLFTWQVLMTWSSSALTCNGVVYGDFMQQARSGSYMTSDAASGQCDVYVIDPSYFAAGMDVLIYDDSNSETNNIASMIGTKLTMGTALQHTYTVADHGKVDTYPGTTPASRIETGWLTAGEMTSQSAAGAYGSGWLATIET
jgi:hypothetical protein